MSQFCKSEGCIIHPLLYRFMQFVNVTGVSVGMIKYSVDPMKTTL